MSVIIQQKCPMCDEILDYEVTSTGERSNGSSHATVTVHAQTTPKSTAHVWTHAPN